MTLNECITKAEIKEGTVPFSSKPRCTCNHTCKCFYDIGKDQAVISMTNQHLSDTNNYAHLGLKRQWNVIWDHVVRHLSGNLLRQIFQQLILIPDPHALFTFSHSVLCYKRLHIMTYITWLCCPNFSLCSANGERRQDGKGIYSPGCHPKGPAWTIKKFISFHGYV